MPARISESRFYMWRTLFAVSHADSVVTSEEMTFMHKVLQDEPFTEAQREILKIDMEQKQDIRFLFGKISDQQDRSDFFTLARPLVWADGDFGSDEQKIILELNQKHQKEVDFETFQASKDLKLEDGGYTPPPPKAKAAQQDGFITRILKKLAGV